MKFKLEKLHIYIIGLIALILPNIVLLKKVEQPMDTIFYMAFPKGEVNFDFFSYYKMIFLIISTGFLLILFAINRWKKLKWHHSYTFLLIYAFFIFTSTFTSPFRELAIRGVGDRYEGITTLLAYLLLFFATFSSIEDKDDIRIILGGVIGGSLIVGTIGIFQYFGYDFFRSNLGRELILTKADIAMKDTLQFKFGKYTIYSTLYNTNFVGSYMVMMVFLGIGLILETIKNKKLNILAYAYTMLMFANLIGCRSRAGFLGAQATTIFALLFFFKYIKVYWKQLSIIITSFIIVFATMNYASKGGSLSDKLYNINTEKNTLRDVYSQEGYLYFESIFGSMKLKEENDQISFLDLQGEELEVEVVRQEIIRDGEEVILPIVYFVDEGYKLFNFILNEDSLIFLYDKKINIPIYFVDGKYKTKGLGNILYELEKIERFKLFDGREKTGSARFYIWSRTIPLLKYTLLTGYGPDTYSIIFPQNDNFGKSISFGMRNIVVDKPHNLYLQIGVNTGVLSLINFIVACAIFLISGIIIYNKKYSKNNILALTIYLGSVAYLVTGLFNDSLVSVAPIFWIYWAIATYMLFIQKREESC